MKTILIMNGPNLSMLGKRDPKHYGSGTLADLENACINKGIELGVKVQCFQSESESAIIRKLHNSMGVIDESYCGDNDQWFMPALAMRDTVIHVNDRICQFRIMKHQPVISFSEVKELHEPDRGGHGSTGRA